MIGMGVSFLHSKDITHRDLKLSNILVCETKDQKIPILKLCDFGISKIGDENTALNKLMTEKFASPEQLRGENPASAFDAWSFGVIAYNLCTGVLPFNPDEKSDVKTKVLSQEPADLTKLDGVEIC